MADDKLCWQSAANDMAAKVECSVDGKLDLHMWYNKEENPTSPPKCTDTPSTAGATEYHFNGLSRTDALAFLQEKACFKQPESYCDPTDKNDDDKACYMYAKLTAPLPADAIPSACAPTTTTVATTGTASNTQDVSMAVAKNILGVSGGLAT